MFDRIIEQELKNWKVNPYRKPLILRGARQVGKTSVIRKFGQENFDQVIEINLENKDQLQLFDQAKTVEDFFQRINLFFDQKIVPGASLLFIDEIQESKNVMELLRFFSEEKPELHVMAAGSLLEAKIGQDGSIPVGRVEYRYLYPLTFFEYLKARNKTALLDSLETIQLKDSFAYGDLASKVFKEYVVVGGMPEAVRSFAETGDYSQVRAIFNRLQTAYVADIRKYSKSKESNKYLEIVLDFGPKAAGTIYKYKNFGGSNYRSREMGDAIQTVEKTMLLNQIWAVNSTLLPIVSKNMRPKKMIWLDVGLVNYVNHAYQELLTGEYKGKIMEQVVGQSLIASGITRPMDLYYWARDKDEGSAEVDFCFQHQSRVVGMEIKSGNVAKMKSLFSLGNIDPTAALVRVSWDNLGSESWKFAEKKYPILSLPFYLIDRYQDFLNA
ncbi:MAG: AAA family ATPase [Chloroflexi bacterium]|nr:AAA family ATPase [Chloroflexota bacterium]